MKERNTTGKYMAGLAVLLIFCIFTVCIMMILMQGASVCRNISQRSELLYEQRTCAGYLTEKIRQAPEAPEIKDFGDGQGIMLEETIDGELWQTWIYCYDGWIREYFGDASVLDDPSLGEKVLPAGNLDFAMKDGLLQIIMEDTEGSSRTIYLYLRNGDSL